MMVRQHAVTIILRCYYFAAAISAAANSMSTDIIQQQLLTETDLQRLKVVQLKEQCKRYGLKISGTKATLINRIVTYLQSQ
jgi:SAP domain